MNKKVVACVLIVVVGILGFVGYRVYDNIRHERVMRGIREAETRYNQLESQLRFIESLQD